MTRPGILQEFPMDQRVTLLQPDVRSQGGPGISSTLPADLLEQVRGRLVSSRF